MRIKSIIITILLSVFAIVNAQKPKTDEEAKYLEVLQNRAQKIVNKLNISDEAKALEVRDIIAKQYWDLNKIHDGKDAKIKVLKASGIDNKALDAKRDKLKAKAQKRIAKLHKKYIKTLNKNLATEQVEGVKNGMTYSVMPNTYNAFLDMIPQLTVVQKKQIYSWLVEARDHAMDAGSSKEKHAWFGKYKGRINNYLSKEGYDLNKLSKEWHKRLKAKGIQL